MKNTPQQTHALSLIEAGIQIRQGSVWPNDPILHVHTYQWSRDGDAVVAHRTVLRDDATPTTDARLAYRTELFRIQRDGAVTRL